MLLGFISDSLFCTPSSDSLFRENTSEEGWDCLPWEHSGAGSRELLGEAESGSSTEKPRTSAEQCNKEKPSAKKHSVHSLGRLGPGVPRVGFNLEWILGSS